VEVVVNADDRHEFVTLRDHLERIIAEQDRRISQALAANRLAVDAALTAAKEAVDKAEKAQERRLDLLNEFRGQAADEARKYAQRNVIEPQLSKLESAVSRLYGGVAVGSGLALAAAVKVFFA